MPSGATATLRHKLALAFACGLGAIAYAPPAGAFGGFYVSGGDASLANSATSVVLMREGLRTVLSMENNYQGPPEQFALVVPVPVVLQKESVKTLKPEVFRKIDQLSAPRLVEYWEQDPCQPHTDEGAARNRVPRAPSPAPGGRVDDLGVKVEAQFSVGEYDVVILSANEAAGLEVWLRQNKYNVPTGSAPYLKPYVASGSKFFVAKIDPKKLRFEARQARLSPLRFHYDSDEFRLPVRLGLINSAGTQDLLVHILARGQRYEVANYPNVTTPTNLDLEPQAREQFGQLYARLFDVLLEKRPGAVVTEYAWDAGSCDPCTQPPLTPAELASLGADVLPGSPSSEATANRPGGPPRPWFAGRASGFVLTRLHTRYSKTSLSDDLVFRAAPPISGGREVRSGPEGALEQSSKPDSINNFQARYAIRYPWTGPVACKEPRRGVWGGPPASAPVEQRERGKGLPQAAADLGYLKRQPIDLAALVKQPVPEIGPLPTSSPQAASNNDGSTPSSRVGCAGCHATPSPAAPFGSALAAMAALWLARAKRKTTPRRGKPGAARPQPGQTLGERT
jgi:hypothetical protein